MGRISKLKLLCGEQNHRCCYCSNEMKLTLPRHTCKIVRDEATIEHVIPVSESGTYAWDNVVAACAQCNNLRGNMDALVFYELISLYLLHRTTTPEEWYQLSRAELGEIQRQFVRTYATILETRAVRCKQSAVRHFVLCQTQGYKLGT